MQELAARPVSIALRNVSALLLGLRALGLDAERIAQRAGVEPVWQSGDPDRQVAGEVLGRVWLEAARLYRREDLALQAGLSVPFGAFGVIDYLTASCATVAEGFSMLARYFKLAASWRGLRIEASAEQVEIVVTDLGEAAAVPDAHAAQGADEYALALLHARFRRSLAAEQWQPSRVRLTRPEPANRTAYEAAFDTAVEFAQPVSSLTLPARSWSQPLQRADRHLQAVLCRHAEHLLEVLAQDDAQLDPIRACIVASLQRGTPGLAQVARALGTSSRTLQRRLSARATSFAALLEDERKRLARDYLSEPSLALTEVAFLLGYNDQTAFSRAFRRWFGKSPAVYRRRQPSSSARIEASRS